MPGRNIRTVAEVDAVSLTVHDVEEKQVRI